MTRSNGADGAVGERGIAGWATVGVVLAVAASTVIYLYEGWYYNGADFGVYHQAAVSLLHGRSPYDFVGPNGLEFTYSPFAALVFTPLGLISSRAALAVWTLVAILALEASTWLVLSRTGPADRRRRAMLTVLVTVAALPLYPVFSELALGQINILLMFVLLTDLLLPHRRRGIGVGLAAAIKLTPLIFVPYLLFTRRFRAAALATLTFAGALALGFAVLPEASARYWGGLFLDVNRVLPPGSDAYNNAFSAALGRLFGHTSVPGPLWTTVGMLAGLTALVLAVRVSRRGDDTLGIVTCAVAGLLITPVAWAAHWVWLVPVLVLWGARAAREHSRPQAAGIILVWLALALDEGWNLRSLLGYPVPTGLTGELLADLPLLSGVAFLVCVAAVSRQPTERSSLPSPSGGLPPSATAL
jgi:alpha-1,2-mannosyltransferase